MNPERAVRTPWSHQHERTDEQIVRSVLHALDEAVDVPSGAVQVSARRGHVTLSGEVDWSYQRDAAAAASRGVSGVKSIVNAITLAPYEHPARLKARVEWTLGCNPTLDLHRIAVDYVGGRIVLRGWALTRRDRDEIERLARATPGVVTVENTLEIGGDTPRTPAGEVLVA
jgi:osmotically-inducible protein OsmY